MDGWIAKTKQKQERIRKGSCMETVVGRYNKNKQLRE